METNVLKKRLNTYKSGKGKLTRVEDEVVMDVLRTWEQWQGRSADLYRELGLSKMQLVTMIQKGKRLVKKGVGAGGEFNVAGGIVAYRLANRALLARLRGRRLGLEAIRPGVPAILYFTTPTCAPCKTIQRPALARLQARLGECLQVIEVDASTRPDLADYWGVLTVPTTFVIDSRGRPRVSTMASPVPESC